MKKLLVGGFGLIVVGMFAFSTYVGGSGETIAKDGGDKVSANVETINYMSKVDKMKFKLDFEDYPKNQMLNDDLQAKADYINAHTKNNEYPPIDNEAVKDPNVQAAIDYIVNMKDKDSQHRISLVMPFGELRLYNTYPKGKYPQELLDEEYKTYIPILNHLEELSQSDALDAIIEETKKQMRFAYMNNYPETYLEAWNKINVVKQTSNDRIYNNY